VWGKVLCRVQGNGFEKENLHNIRNPTQVIKMTKYCKHMKFFPTSNETIDTQWTMK
jgi:hypothetical protein